MRKTIIIIAAALGSAGVGATATARDVAGQYFCCDSVNDDGDRGNGCRRTTEARVHECKGDVLLCDGSWTKSKRTVTCV